MHHDNYRVQDSRATLALGLAVLLEGPVAVYFLALPLLVLIRSGNVAIAASSVMVTGPALLVVALFVRGIYHRDPLMLGIAVLVQPVLAVLYFGAIAHVIRTRSGWAGEIAMVLVFVIGALVLMLSITEFRGGRTRRRKV
jgi:hypothetical protein